MKDGFVISLLSCTVCIGFKFNIDEFDSTPLNHNLDLLPLKILEDFFQYYTLEWLDNNLGLWNSSM